jgi:EAL domain-containing protein (putative c-di-GMP-specific phosphodiesterase class I)
VQRHEKTFKRKQGEELRAFEDLTELSDSHGGRTPPGTFIRSLQVQGLACCPATLEELQSWCGKEMGKL